MASMAKQVSKIGRASGEPEVVADAISAALREACIPDNGAGELLPAWTLALWGLATHFVEENGDAECSNLRQSF